MSKITITNKQAVLSRKNRKYKNFRKTGETEPGHVRNHPMERKLGLIALLALLAILEWKLGLLGLLALLAILMEWKLDSGKKNVKYIQRFLRNAKLSIQQYLSNNIQARKITQFSYYLVVVEAQFLKLSFANISKQQDIFFHIYLG